MGSVLVLRPKSRFLIGWSIFLVGAIFFSSLIFPYRILSQQFFFDGFSLFILLLFFLDLLLGFKTPVKKGLQWVTEAKSIERNYLRSWFLPDLLVVISFIFLAILFQGEELSVSPFSGILFLLPLVKLFKIPGIFRHLQENLDINPSIMRLIVFAFSFFLLTHFMAIGWLVIRTLDPGMTFQIQYLQALYWCVTTIATVGYGDITPDMGNPIQVIYTMVVQLIGVGVYGFIIGNIASVIANLDARRVAFKQKMEEIREYMKARKFPPDLQRKVRDYYTYMWETHGCTGNEVFLSELPHTIATDIAIFLNRHILEKVHIFRDADEVFKREVIRQLELVIFLPGDYIIQQGEHGDCMYFMSFGEVEVSIGDRIIARLKDGSAFGESALLEDGIRTASVRALHYCETYRLLKEDFHGLRKKYKEFDSRVQEIIEERKSKGEMQNQNQ